MADSDPTNLFDANDEDSTAIVRLSSLGRATPIPPRDRYVLVQVQGEDLGKVVPLTSGDFVIGRQQTCNLPLADSSVSRKHAQIRLVEGHHLLEDLGSANGTYVASCRITTHQLCDGDVVQFGSTIAYRYSITDEQQLAMLKYLYDASVTDALTGAFNREYFDARLTSEIAYARRHAVSLCLLMIDVDHFKLVNDNYGHQTGDAALVKLVETVRTKLRLEDVFCRYGGEEFAAILRTTDLDAGVVAAERIRQAVEVVHVPTEAGPVTFTVSIGCASIACSLEASPEDLVKVADRRLYAAKHGGRNRVVSQG